MHICQILEQRPTTFSFEFFPPRSAQGADELFETIRKLGKLDPAFVSVTYGAGGSTRDLTHDLVLRIKQTTRLEAIPHLTCVAHSAAEIEDILMRYARAGISNVLALGGDPPKAELRYARDQDPFRFACDLVRFIAAFNRAGKHPEPRGFGTGVAGFPEGHPATPNRLLEMDYLKAKVDSGAHYIVTQLFFDNRDFFDFRERCELAGIQLPILAGVMPITTVAGMRRMGDLAGGARFPAPLLRAVSVAAEDPNAVRQVGIEWTTRQCRELIDQGARGIHFYTLNKSLSTLEIYRNLGLVPRS
jgi:methylenetetrahydrofolate reductase (NADPH)